MIQKKPPSRRGAPSSEESRFSTFTYRGEGFVVFSTPVAPRRFGALTPSEEQILAGVTRGMSNAAIARERQTSVRTIANQIASLFRKTGATSRAELVRLASTSDPSSTDPSKTLR